MVDSIQNTTAYFKRSLELNQLVTVDYRQSDNFVKVSASEIEMGILDEEITRKLFEQYRNNTKSDKASTSKSIPVVISLKTLQSDTSYKVLNGLLLLPAHLEVDGCLDYDLDSHNPWIPLERLKSAHGKDLDIMVGRLSEFWTFQQKQSEILKAGIETWPDYVQYAKRLFKAVYDCSDAELEESGSEIIVEKCYVKIQENVNANGPIINLYDTLLAQRKCPSLYRTIAEPIYEQVPANDLDEGTFAVDNVLDTCGQMNGDFPLAPSQRQSVHAFMQMTDGSVLAVSGPPGTGKTTMLQSVVANLITKHALAGKSAPLIVGTSTNNQAVTNIIDSFANVVSGERGTLDFRWLPQIQESGQDEKVIEGTISGFATYCPSSKRTQEARKHGYLVENLRKSGIYTEYSTVDYISVAQQAFLKFASEFLGEEFTRVDTVREQLKDHLKSIDDIRKSIIADHVAYWEKWEEGIFLEHCLDVSRQRLATINREIGETRTRLKFWSALKKEYPAKLTILERIKRVKPDQSDIIYANKTSEETFGETIKTLEGVCQIHVDEIKRLELLKQNEDKRILQYQSDLDEINELYKRAKNYMLNLELFGFTSNVDNRDNATVPWLKKHDGDEKPPDQRSINSLEELDEFLDITLRVCEFWLAVHIYESEWLMTCLESKTIPSEERFKTTEPIQRMFWEQITSLTPCFVMTAYQLPKFFKLYERENSHKYDFEAIDLLIVDEAGQVDTPVGIASFSLAKKAVVVGDIHQLAPVWGYDEPSDLEIALNCGMEERDWDSLKETGLTASNPSSLMKVATHACPWAYSDSEGGLFLTEHRRCYDEIIEYCNELMYEGRLEAKRGSAQADEKNPLRGKIPPFAFKAVIGSESVRSGSSRRNIAEAEAIVSWIEVNFSTICTMYGNACKTNQLLGVVTPFAAQARCISQKLRAQSADLAKAITVGTAHVLQGAERQIILFSAVYGDNDDTADFIDRQPELMNVAVSRAKDLFIVFGSRKRLEDPGKVFRVMRKHAEEDFCEIIVEKKSTDAILSELLDCTYDDSASSPERTDRNETQESSCESIESVQRPGTVITEDQNLCQSLSKWLKQWNDVGTYPETAPMSAKDVNRILLQYGFIELVEGKGWQATEAGKGIGIVSSTGRDEKGSEYAYCEYTVAAANEILRILQELKL